MQTNRGFLLGLNIELVQEEMIWENRTLDVCAGKDE